MLWFLLFCVLESSFVLFELYFRFRAFGSVLVTEWLPIRE